MRNLKSRLLTLGVGLVLAAVATVEAAPINGRYKLKNRASGRFLDNYGGTTDGALIKQDPSSASNNQKWNLTTTGANSKLQCLTASKYLDSLGKAGNEDPSGHDPIAQWASSGSNNQQWTLQDVGSGYWRIVNVANGKAIDTGGLTNGGAVMTFWDVSGSNSQQWQFVPDFTHPGIAHNNADLDRMKNNVAVEPYATAFATFSATKWASPTYTPNPVVDETIANGQFEIRDDSKAAYYNAIMWYVTGNTVHRDKAKSIINAWVTTMQTFDVADHLSAGPAVQNYTNAAEILRYKGGGWTATEISDLENWLVSKLMPPLLTPGGSFAADTLEAGNHGATQVIGLIAMGIFCNRTDIFDFGKNSYLKNDDGYTYGVLQYIDVSGQNYESGRDQGHAVGGAGCYPQCAEMAWKQGVDLYATGGNRILAGMELAATFNLMWDLTPVSWTAQDGSIRDSITTLQRGPTGNQGFLLSYNHYANRKGLGSQISNTKRMMDWNFPYSSSGEYFLYMTNSSGTTPVRPTDWGQYDATKVYLMDANQRAGFGVGSFNNAAMLAAGGKQNGASWIRVPRGWKVTLYDGDNLDGASVVVTTTEESLGRAGLSFNDRTSSLKVESTGGDTSMDVTFYDGPDFTGTSVVRGPGWYTTAQMGIADNTISSIKVPSGYIVVVWDQGDTPASRGLTAPLLGSVADLGGNSNKISSFLVMKRF